MVPIRALQVDFRKDLPKALGDSCGIYSSPREGGLLLLGLTAVVPIRDRAALSAIQAKIVGGSLAQSFMSQIHARSSSQQKPPCLHIRRPEDFLLRRHGL